MEYYIAAMPSDPFRLRLELHFVDDQIREPRLDDFEQKLGIVSLR